MASIPSTSSALTDWPALWLRKLATLSMTTSGGEAEEDTVLDAGVGVCGGGCLDSRLESRCSEVNAWEVDSLLPDLKTTDYLGRKLNKNRSVSYRRVFY